MSQEQIKEIVQKLNQRLVACTKFTNNWNNSVYDVVTNTSDYVIKLYHKPSKEADMMKLIPKGVPIPKIIYHDEHCLVLQKISGNTLREAYNHIEDKDAFFEEYGKLMRILHVPCEANKDELLKKINSNMHKWCHNLDRPDILQLWEKQKTVLQNDSVVLCHGDSATTNILVADNKIQALIDFEFMGYDLAIKDFCASIRDNYLFENRLSIMKGYNPHEHWEQMWMLYRLYNLMRNISKLESLKWPDLNEEENQKRRGIVKSEWLTLLEKTIAMLE